MPSNLFVGLEEFWENRAERNRQQYETFSEAEQKQLEENKSTFLLNLASQEYAKAVDFKKIDIPVLAPEFKEERGGDYKMISFFAKKARGLMAAYAVKNEITDMEDLKGFNYEGYGFNSRLSENNKLNWVFTRKTK